MSVCPFAPMVEPLDPHCTYGDSDSGSGSDSDSEDALLRLMDAAVSVACENTSAGSATTTGKKRKPEDAPLAEGASPDASPTKRVPDDDFVDLTEDDQLGAVGMDGAQDPDATEDEEDDDHDDDHDDDDRTQDADGEDEEEEEDRHGEQGDVAQATSADTLVVAYDPPKHATDRDPRWGCTVCVTDPHRANIVCSRAVTKHLPGTGQVWTAGEGGRYSTLPRTVLAPFVPAGPAAAGPFRIGDVVQVAADAADLGASGVAAGGAAGAAPCGAFYHRSPKAACGLLGTVVALDGNAVQVTTFDPGPSAPVYTDALVPRTVSAPFDRVSLRARLVHAGADAGTVPAKVQRYIDRYKQFADAYARLKDEEARNAQAQREAGEREALRRRKIEEESDAEAYKIQRLREEYAEKMRQRGQCGRRSQRPVELRAGDFVQYYVRHNPVKSRVARIDSCGNVELDSALNAHPDGGMMCTVVSPEGHRYAACALDEMRKVPGQVDDYDTVRCRVADAVRRVALEAVQEAAASEAASE